MNSLPPRVVNIFFEIAGSGAVARGDAIAILQLPVSEEPLKAGLRLTVTRAKKVGMRRLLLQRNSSVETRGMDDRLPTRAPALFRFECLHEQYYYDLC